MEVRRTWTLAPFPAWGSGNCLRSGLFEWQPVDLTIVSAWFTCIANREPVVDLMIDHNHRAWTVSSSRSAVRHPSAGRANRYSPRRYASFVRPAASREGDAVIIKTHRKTVKQRYDGRVRSATPSRCYQPFNDGPFRRQFPGPALSRAEKTKQPPHARKNTKKNHPLRMKHSSS